MRVHRCAQILDKQMRVVPRGDPDVAVAHQPLHAMHVDALAQQRGREGMAAPATTVLVASNDSSSSEGVPEDLLRIRLARR